MAVRPGSAGARRDRMLLMKHCNPKPVGTRSFSECESGQACMGHLATANSMCTAQLEEGSCYEP